MVGGERGEMGYESGVGWRRGGLSLCSTMKEVLHGTCHFGAVFYFRTSVSTSCSPTILVSSEVKIRPSSGIAELSFVQPVRIEGFYKGDTNSSSTSVGYDNQQVQSLPGFA